MKSYEQFFLHAALAGAVIWAMVILLFVLLAKGLYLYFTSPK